jgi:murein DD-endopeptidase MepM/ murein hydrolase activator NlpD
MWPMLTGTRNARTFAYTCRLPAALVRDVVAFCTPPPLACGTSPNTYYRLPFTGGWPTWRMGQGNCGNFTHTNKSKFAFDMPAPQGTPIRAARGGVVVDLRESGSGNCYDSGAGECVNCGPTPANFVKIQHQDGTYGCYFHMPQNGVSVVKGQKIYRGDVLGVVGNTGCSSTPHLHFEARATLTGPSIPASFEAFTACTNLGVVFPCLPLRECYVPQSKDALFSSNKGWWE